MNVLQKPFDNVHVRRAVAYALNRTALINAWGGYATPVYQFLTAGLLENIGTAANVKTALASVPAYPFNLAKAKAEMAKSPYSHGVTATISVEGSGSYPNVSQAIQAELARIGIHLTFKVMTIDAQVANMTSANRKGILTNFTYSGAVSRDPGEAFDFQMGSSNISAGNWNTMNWAPPSMDKLINDGFATTDNSARLKIYRQIERRVRAGRPLHPALQSGRDRSPVERLHLVQTSTAITTTSDPGCSGCPRSDRQPSSNPRHEGGGGGLSGGRLLVFVLRRLVVLAVLLVVISFVTFTLLEIAPGNLLDILIGRQTAYGRDRATSDQGVPSE